MTASSAAFPSLGIGLGVPGMADTSAQRRQELESQVDCKQHMAVLYTLHKVCTVHTYVSVYVQSVLVTGCGTVMYVTAMAYKACCI